jgi:hypothetical protein
MAHPVHLIRRFVGSLSPAQPAPAEERWAQSFLLPGEVALWRRMSNPDRRHAIGVAHRVEDALGAGATRPVLAAALLHDAGKVTSGLGTSGRVLATLAAGAFGHHRAHAWAASRRRPTRRIGLYLLHAQLGADLLTAAGSDPLTVAWAREHHDDPSRWTVPSELADALKVADDD